MSSSGDRRLDLLFFELERAAGFLAGDFFMARINSSGRNVQLWSALAGPYQYFLRDPRRRERAADSHAVVAQAP